MTVDAPRAKPGLFVRLDFRQQGGGAHGPSLEATRHVAEAAEEELGRRPAPAASGRHRDWMTATSQRGVVGHAEGRAALADVVGPRSQPRGVARVLRRLVSRFANTPETLVPVEALGVGTLLTLPIAQSLTASIWLAFFLERSGPPRT